MTCFLPSAREKNVNLKAPTMPNMPTYAYILIRFANCKAQTFPIYFYVKFANSKDPSLSSMPSYTFM